MRLDPGIGLCRRDDGGRGQGPTEVKVVPLPSLDGLGVEGEVILDPRPDPRVAPCTERAGDPLRIGAAEQLEECTDLHARHGDPPACGRCSGGHRVANGDETGATELPPVEVEQAAADHDAARRHGDGWVRPLGEGGDRSTGGVEGIDMAKDPQVGVSGRPDDHRRDVAVLVGEDVGVVALEHAAPRERTRQRTRGHVASPPVGPGNVGHAGVSAELRGRRQPGQATACVDHEIGAVDRAVHHHAPDAPVRLDKALHATDGDGQPFDFGRCLPQRSLVGHSTGPHPDGRGGGTRRRHLKRLGTEIEPCIPRLRPRRLQQVAHLRTEPVCLFELHHPAARPGSVRRRAGITVDGNNTVPAACERRAERQARRSRAHDDHIHGLFLSLHY